MPEFVVKTQLVRTQCRGACTISNCNIEAGEEILREEPVGYSPYDHQLNFDALLSPVEKSVISKCPIKIHTCILASRILTYMENNVLSRQKLSKLCDSSQFVSQTILEKLNVVSDIVYKLAGKIYPLDDTVLLILKIMVNAFTITDDEMNPIGIGLYLKAAEINHSCDPNSFQSFHGNKIYIRALRNISTHEEITISYIDIGRPNWWRRKELLHSYGFICHCRRCTTYEFQEYLSCQNILDSRKGSQRCNGRCDLHFSVWYEIYRSWLNGTCTLNVLHNEFNENTIMRSHKEDFDDFLPLPFQQFHPYFNQNISPSSNSSYINSNLLLQCHQCQSIFPMTIITNSWYLICHEFKLLRKKNNIPSSDDILLLKKLNNKINEIIYGYHYSKMEIENMLCLRYIRLNLFSDAANILSNNLLHQFHYSYPYNHPIIAIQQLQLGKLRNYLRDNIKEGIYSLQKAIQVLKISHGLQHSLVTSAYSILEEITYY